MGGNAITFIITIVFSLILTRVYPPKEFGAFTFFLSFSIIFSVISTLKLENLFFLVERKDNSRVFILGTISVLIISSLSYPLLILIKYFFPTLNRIDNYWYVILPITIFFTGEYYCLKNYFSKNGNYKLMAFASISKVIIANSFFLIYGLFSSHYYGFMLGTVLGQAIESIILYIYFIKEVKFSINDFNVSRLKRLFVRYKKFPIFSLPGELISTYSSQNPVILLTLFFGEAATGYYALVQRILGLPIKLVSSSTSEVFRREAVIQFGKKGEFVDVVIKTFKGLLYIGVIPFIVLFFTGAELIPIVFGNTWVMAGDYLKIMLILFLFQFSISPLGYSFYIIEKQEIDLLWQVALLIITTIALISGSYIGGALYSLTIFVLSYAMMYLVYLYLIIRFSSERKSINEV